MLAVAADFLSLDLHVGLTDSQNLGVTSDAMDACIMCQRLCQSSETAATLTELMLINQDDKTQHSTDHLTDERWTAMIYSILMTGVTRSLRAINGRLQMSLEMESCVLEMRSASASDTTQPCR
jgi:hypothetical protein